MANKGQSIGVFDEVRVENQSAGMCGLPCFQRWPNLMPYLSSGDGVRAAEAKKVRWPKYHIKRNTMPCLSPIQLKRAKERIVVPCGRCAGCLQSRRAGWTFRLLQQEKVSKSSVFLTLTYDEKNVPMVANDGDFIVGYNPDYRIDAYDGFNLTLYKKHLQDYFKRVRKYTTDLKYYAVGEYGEKTKRPHYHAIVFNAKPELLAKKWDFGFSQQDTVTQASIHYVTKYIMKSKSKVHDVEPEFAIMSKGLGINYVDLAKKYHRDLLTDILTLEGGFKMKMPRYLKEKIFTEEERKIIGKNNRESLEELFDKQSMQDIINRIKFIEAKATRTSKSKKF